MNQKQSTLIYTMKLRHLFMAVIAGAFAFTSCEDELDLGAAKVSFVEPAGLVLNFGPEESSSTVTFVSTRDWNISEVLSNTLPDWIALSATSGEASTQEQSVTVTVMANPGNDRETGVTFTIGLAKATLTVKQAGKMGEVKKGSGTKEDPYTVAGVLEFIETLGADKESEKVYIKGVVTSVKTTFEASGYGNGTFYIADALDAEQTFYVYQTYYLGNRKWKSGDAEVKEGDEVIIYGPVVNYKGNTPETAGKGASFVYSLNGKSDGGDEPVNEGTAKGKGTLEEPYNPAGAAAFAKSLGTDVQSEKVYIKGKVSKVGTTFEASGNYGNATFNIVDAEDGTGDFYVFQTYYLGNRQWKSGDTEIKEGDIVIIYGPVVNYKGNTPETVGKGASYIYSLNGKTEGGAGGDDTDYSKVPAKTVKEFIAAADTQNYYKLTGKVSNFNSNYCSFDLTDETGSIYVYSVDNKADWSSKVANGGTVSLAGKYAFYAAKEQHEVVNAYILTFEGGGNTGNDDTPTGNGTLESPYNPKAAYDAAAQLEKDAKSENDVYIAGVISSIKYTFSAQYGTATFNISEDGTTNGTQFPCYSVLYLGNRAWVEGDTQVAVGDRVVICGKITNYGGNTPETASKLAYIYSLNGQTTIEQGPVFGVEKTEINVAATATGAVIKVTGNVPWTATSTAIIEGGSVSGNGAGEFSVAFDPNTDTENTKVYTATVVTTADVANKEIRVTITQAKASSGSGTHYEAQWLKDQLAAAADKGAVNQMDDVISFTNSSSYSGSVTELRIYKGQTLTIKAAAGYTIEDIEIGCTAAGEEKYGPGCFTVTPDGYTFNDKSGRWAGDAQEVVFTAATNQVRIVDLKVHYKD